MATCHLSPCSCHQALSHLGQPTAISRSSSKVSPGFWKAGTFPEANVCPIYTRETGAGNLRGTAVQEGPGVVPAKGFNSLLPKQCPVTTQRRCPQKQFGPGGDFCVPPVAMAAQSSSTFLRPPVPVMASAGAQGPVCHILGAELPPQPHTHPHCCDCPLSTARAGVTTAGQLPPFPGFHTAPRSACQPQATASTRGQPTGDTHLGTDEFPNH